MFTHYPVYDGHVSVSLGALQGGYVRKITEGINRYRAVEGTQQRGPYMPENAGEFVAKHRNSRGKDEVFAILRHDGSQPKNYRFIGLVGIHGISWPSGYGTGGIMIFSTSERGGAGTEALLLLLYHCFSTLGLRKVDASVKAFNGPSLGHAVKCGFQIVGHRKAHHYHDGSYVDEILLEVFKEDWKPIWDRYNESKTLPKLTNSQRELVSKETS